MMCAWLDWVLHDVFMVRLGFSMMCLCFVQVLHEVFMARLGFVWCVYDLFGFCMMCL